MIVSVLFVTSFFYHNNQLSLANFSVPIVLVSASFIDLATALFGNMIQVKRSQVNPAKNTISAKKQKYRKMVLNS